VKIAWNSPLIFGCCEHSTKLLGFLNKTGNFFTSKVAVSSWGRTWLYEARTGNCSVVSILTHLMLLT